MNKPVLSSILCFLVAICSAVGQDYAVDKIDKALLVEANVVKREENIHFEVISPTNTVLHRKCALTILNDQGATESDFTFFYSKLSSLKSFSGTLYDASGREIKKIRFKDLKDESAVSASSLMDDYRVKRYQLYHRNYPYTIVYDYTEQNNNSLFFENWQPVVSEKYSVEQSQFTISYPKGTKIRYKAFHYPGEARSAVEKDRELLTWEIKDFKSIKWEPYSPPISNLSPLVLTGPETFQIEGYKGDMSSWENFGKFFSSLLANRQSLPERVQADVSRLTGDLKNDRDKVQALYQYLQKNTRYISIQLGLGGWQPFDASYVANNSYGDCKALTNYMASLLKEAGITSHYTLIRAGNRNRAIAADMPSQQFNHVILAVPMPADTIWLECTSQTLPAGYLSGFTANRYGLLIDDQGGKLVRTPKYDLDNNLQIRNIQARISPQGSLETDATSLYTGLQQDNLYDRIHQLSKEKQKEYLNTHLPLPSYQVSAFRYEPGMGLIPFVKESLSLQAGNYAQLTSTRLMVEPNVLSKRLWRLPKEARQHPIVFDFPFHDIDTVQIEVPAGYSVEMIPESNVIKSAFGEYKSNYEFSDGRLLYHRNYRQFEGEHPASAYQDVLAFHEAVYAADRKQVIFKREVD